MPYDPSQHPAAPSGDEVLDARPGAALYAYAASPTFTFLAHPERWDVFLTTDGAEVLPVLKKLPHQPGVSNVEQVRTGDNQLIGDPTKAIALMRSKQAYIEIPRGIAVEAFGERFRGYVHRYNGTKGAIHLERWIRLYKIGNNVYEQRDEAGYHVFLRQVRDLFLGGGPDRAVAAGLEAGLKQALGKARVNAERSPTAAGSIPKLEAKLEAFEAPRRQAREAAAAKKMGGQRPAATPPGPQASVPAPAVAAPAPPEQAAPPYNVIDGGGDEPAPPPETTDHQPPEGVFRPDPEAAAATAPSRSRRVKGGP